MEENERTEQEKPEEQLEDMSKEVKEESKQETETIYESIDKPKRKEKKEKKPFNLRNFYDKEYKKLLLIPLILLFLAIFSIAFQTIKTGDFINRDVTLKGGLTITIPLEKQIDVIELQNYLSKQFVSNDMSVRKLKRAGSDIGIIIDSDIDGAKKSEIDLLIKKIGEKLDIKLEEGKYTAEFIGSSLGASFFNETFRALLLAFLFMSIVVFFYFRTPIPSLAVILAAFSDMVITLAVVNLMGIKISTAGIAAFLMLIGYSVDTDILLTTRVLKRKEGTEMDRVISAFKTGIMMTLTALVAVTAALIFTDSEVIRQIMVILFIGLLADIINTWIQNVGILRLYLERKHKKMATPNEQA